MADILSDANLSKQEEKAAAFSERVKRSRRERFITLAIIYTVLILGAILAILPFFWMISTSLMTLGETLNRRWLPATPRFGNYAEAWTTAKFNLYFMNSVIITTLTITGLLVTSILSGYAFARIRFVGREIIFTLLLATLMVPQSVTMIPSYLLVTGNIDSLPPPLLTGEFPFIEFGVSWINKLPALTVPFMATAFAIFFLRQFFAQIPYELWDAARIDGSGHLRFLVQICLPIVRPAVMTLALLTFISSWNAFLWPLIVTRNDDWRPLVVGLYNFQTDAGPEVHLLMAGAFITTVPLILLFMVTQRTFIESVASTGIK